MWQARLYLSPSKWAMATRCLFHKPCEQYVHAQGMLSRSMLTVCARVGCTATASLTSNAITQRVHECGILKVARKEAAGYPTKYPPSTSVKEVLEWNCDLQHFGFNVRLPGTGALIKTVATRKVTAAAVLPALRTWRD